MSVKVLTAREAADLIPNGVNLATNGFIGASFPEEIAIAIEQRFLETGAPEMYLMYCKHKSEETHVFDDSGHRPESYGLQ